MTEREESVACVVLASGFGRRYGQTDRENLLANKLGEKLPCGQTIIERTISNYQGVFKSVYVVLRPEHINTLKELSANHTDVCYLPNFHADLGMSQSIVEAIKQVPMPKSQKVQALDDSESALVPTLTPTPAFKGWLITLADMPYVSPSTVMAILSYASSNNIVQPKYQGRSGHPVFFGKSFAEPLKSLKGDIGARDVIQYAATQNRVIKLAVDDPGINWDIDRPEDIQTDLGKLD